MKLPPLVFLAALGAFAFARVQAQSPAMPVVVVSAPLLLPAQPGASATAAIARIEVKAAPGVGGVVFTQRVPPEAGRMLAAVVTQIDKLHPGKLRTGRTEITFNGTISVDDLDASGLAIAVALDAFSGGWTPDPGFIALGAFDAMGEVRPVKDAIPRLLAALKSGAKRVVMTEKQVAQVTDLMITTGPARFATTQFFSVNSYEDVRAIADTRSTPELSKAMREFTSVQTRLVAPDANATEILRDPDAQESLRQTLTGAPTCLSARLLLRATSGQFDKLSAEGTVLAIETMAPTIFATVQSRAPNDLTKLTNAAAQAEIARLLAARAQFDRRSLPLLEAVINYGEAVRTYTERPPDSPAEYAARNRTLMLTAREVVSTLTQFKIPRR